MRLTKDDIEAFGHFSGDVNPMHVSESFARRTPFGEPIAHGMLGCIAALDEAVLDISHGVTGLREMEAQFPRPLFPQTTYRVSRAMTVSENGADEGKAAARLSVFDGPHRCLDIALVRGAPAIGALGVPTTGRTEPADRALSELDCGLDASGGYAPREEAISELTRQWPGAAGALGIGWITAMAWASFLAGMELPGRHGLLCRVRLHAYPPAYRGSLRYTARVVDVDRHFGLVAVTGRLFAADSVVADVEFDALVSSPAPIPSLAAIDRLLAPSTRLTGRTAVVVGGSRGLGAGLALALAGQGCRVLAGHREAGALTPVSRQLFGRGELLSVTGDASTAEWAEAVSRRLAEGGGRLDYLVLNAAPPIGSATFTPEGVSRISGYAARALDLVGVPLSGLADALRRSRGRCLTVSSAAVDDPPEEWPHYVAAKAAVEKLAHWSAAAYPEIGWFAVRPGMMLTDQVNTPAGREMAAPVEDVAARICGAFLEAEAEPGRLRYLSTGLPAPVSVLPDNCR